MCPEGAQVELERERCVPKLLKLSSEVSECKPLQAGPAEQPVHQRETGDEVAVGLRQDRGLHSSTSQLNLSRV